MAKKKNKQKTALISVLVPFFKGTVLGRLLLFTLVFALMIGLNLLISANNFERFQFITGIEVLLCLMTLSIFYLVRGQKA